MFKILIFTSLIFFYSDILAQENLNFYKVPQLEIVDLNKKMASKDFDFGFNNNESIENSIEIGYYIWIVDSWYKVTNSDDVFNSQKEFPYYFSIDKNSVMDLQIKGRSGSVYSFPLEGISNYLISDLEYKNELNHLNDDKSNDVIINNEISLSEIDANRAVFLQNANTDVNVEAVNTLVELNVVSNGIVENSVNENSVNNSESKPVSSEKMFPQKAFKNAVSSGYNGAKIDWILDIDKKSNNSIYELAQNFGFEGSYYDWIKTIIGEDGQIDYANDVNAGFQGSFKNWIEIKIKLASDFKNDNQMKNLLVVPNLPLPLSNDSNEILEFDLYAYYDQYFGNSINRNSLNKMKLKREDLEYEITWYDSKKIEILDVVDLGVIRYKALNAKGANTTSINIRYIRP